MRHILDQGYNVAWSDADAYWLRNPFTLFDRSPDLVVAWSNASELLEGGTYPAGELLGKLRMHLAMCGWAYHHGNGWGYLSVTLQGFAGN